MDAATRRQAERDNLRALIEANEAIHGKITVAELQSAREEIYGETAIMTGAARVLAALAVSDSEVLQRSLPRVVPWMRYLPPSDVERLIADLISAAGPAADSGNAAPLAQLLISWKHTAEIHADPDLYRAVTRPIEDECTIRTALDPPVGGEPHVET